MANLISLTAIPLTGATNWTSPCEAFEQQVDNIQTVKSYTGTQYGINAVLNVKYVVANHFETQTIYTSESVATVKARANAPLA